MLTDASNALTAARARDGELVAEIDANTEALLSATGKDRERLLSERACHAAERDALPGMLEILARRYAEAVIAACHYIHRQATEVHNEADAVSARHSLERTRTIDALTLLECSSQDHEKAEAKRAELRELNTRLQPSRQRREEARIVIAFIEHTLNQLLGEGQLTGQIHRDRIERYVQRSTRKVA